MQSNGAIIYRRWRTICLLLLSLWLAPAAVTADSGDIEPAITAYRGRMAAQADRPLATQDTKPAVRTRDTLTPREPVAMPANNPTMPPRQALLTTPATTSQPAPDDILFEIPDPVEVDSVYDRRREMLQRDEPDARVLENFRQVVDHTRVLLKLVKRTRETRLGLAECIQRALQNNYTIRYEAYNPAISQTQIVQAEAAFDASFFLDTSFADLDQPTFRQYSRNYADGRSVQGGLRKLLPTGMQVSTSLRTQYNRTDTELLGGNPSKNPLNPLTSTSFVTELTQPVLRGFGLDYNRRQITLARIGRDSVEREFLKQVRDTLFNVEAAYWQLVQARREVVIQAETTAQNLATFRSIESLMTHTATQVQLNNSRSRYQSRYVVYLESLKTLRDAEDTLKNLLNDPQLLLSEDIEVIPTEALLATPFVLDQFGEVRTALDHRDEIMQARLAIESARVNTATAKNETLPQLDLNFQYEVSGLANEPGDSFDNMNSGRFMSYNLRAIFSYPLGNRGPEAALRRAVLQESQSIVQLHKITDLVVQEVNNAVRTLVVRYAQVPPQLDAVQAAVINLRALQARTERIDPAYLETELNGVEQIASTRRTLLSVMVGYNTGIVELEKAKGTLLDFNNVVVIDDPGRR